MSATPDAEWLVRQIEKNLTTRVRILTPSEWSEKKRYLPPSTSGLSGYYRFEITPYTKEIIDCMSPESDVRHVTIMKGVQIGATTLLENTIGFYISEVKTAPMMLVSSDNELAKIRMESYVVPMLKHSGLDHLVHSLDEQNPRKTGRTDKKYEWEGGGSLIPIGAVNANRLRSLSIQVLLRDEIDSWPDNVGKDGDPVKLSMDRTVAFEASRKIFDVSTPLVKGSSKIETLFEAGDQRRYMVRCLACKHPQSLRWSRVNKDTGTATGMVWEIKEGRLVGGSVRYLCEACGHPHRNEDKTRLFAEGNAEWVPTAVPQTPHHRSYHIPALLSPLGMQSWQSCVEGWLEAWDTQSGRPKDNAKLQVFYNNVLGAPFEVRGERLGFETVSSHRRHDYSYGQIPNTWAREFCGSPVLTVTCAVDVHAKNLAVAVIGWCRGRRAILLDYWRFVGNTENLEDAATWGRLRQLVQTPTLYVADDGQPYKIEMTLVDSGFQTDTVYQFCAEYSLCVYPVHGSERPPGNSPIKEFWHTVAPGGFIRWGASVSMYKERWSATLRQQWDGLSLQPEGHFNAPIDATDAQLKELTQETKREKIDKKDGKHQGFYWHRPGGSDNELWDLLQYSAVALDILAYDCCIRRMARDSIDWNAFWASLE